MKIIHISAECYPAAKAGGLGDVVGALPKYLNKAGAETAVIIPKYRTKWLNNQRYFELFRGLVRLNQDYIPFKVEQVIGTDLGYPLFVIDIPGKFDRPGVYLDEHGNGYGDEVERAICFQQAALKWIQVLPQKPKVIHCHDHHTGLIPFFMKHALEFKSLAHIPTVFTIHNGQYHGAFRWDKINLLPFFDGDARGMIEWADWVNPLAAGIKNCWRLTTVSPGYLEELHQSANGLEKLINMEWMKSSGILNGIDTKVWDPYTDPLIPIHLQGEDIHNFKAANKWELKKKFQFNPDLPVITFIGRLVGEKGADLLPGLIRRFIGSGGQAAILVLGTGMKGVEESLRSMAYHYSGYFDAALEYNEGIAHQLYAGSDFMFMPSRVEPCGLNQMYAMRYGTVPIVRSVGGLKDTIVDIGDPGGRGIRFNNFSVEDAMGAFYRATELYRNRDLFEGLRYHIMTIDMSWERSASEYISIYNQLNDIN